MTTWPLISRNKVEDSKVCVPVERCTESENVVLKKAAQDVSPVAIIVLDCVLNPPCMLSSWTSGILSRLLIGYRSA